MNATKHRLTTSWMDIAGNAYEARIYVDVMKYFRDPEDVYASADPATIEWQRGEPIDPVQGSSLTLRLMSDSDRQFADLYTVDPFGARIEVDRNGELYWSGTLDPESYEEPYTAELGYVVELTFADFGPLDRVNWTGTGIMSVQAIIEDCLASAELSEDTQLDMRTTTERYSAEGAFEALDFGSIYLDVSNFYDEEGEAMSKRAVLEAVLQPFGMKAVQRNGKVCVWDINAMLEEASQQVQWCSTDQRMAAARTYNNVEVTFSPYSATTMQTCDTEDINKGMTGGDEYKTSNDWANAAEGFTFVASTVADATNLPYDVTTAKESNKPIAKPFAIKADFSGSDCGGVCAYRKGNDSLDYSNALMPNSIMDVGYNAIYADSTHFGGNNNSRWIIRKTGIACPVSKQGVCLSLKLSALIDCRYNPFEPSAGHNEEGNYGRMSKLRMACIPARVIWHGANGTTKHVANYDSVFNYDKHTSAKPALWASGEGALGDCLLCYYDVSNYKEGNAIGGWKTNRHGIPCYWPSISERVQKMAEGQLIEIPGPGTIDIEIGTGVCFPPCENYSAWCYGAGPYEEMRWLLYGDLSLEVVKTNGNALSGQDVVDSAWITKGAKETLSITTTCGTLPDSVNNPCARGAFLQVGQNGYVPREQFGRAGVNDRIERLLIGTIFSQYAGRKVELTGTAEIVPQWCARTDRATSGKFMVVGETQDLKQNESEIDMVQIAADDYKAVDFT